MMEEGWLLRGGGFEREETLARRGVGQVEASTTAGGGPEVGKLVGGREGGIQDGKRWQCIQLGSR